MSATATQSSPSQLCRLGHTPFPTKAVLVGRRIDGVVHVYDYPHDGHGRPYFVEAGFESKAELAVLIADRRRQAEPCASCWVLRRGYTSFDGSSSLAGHS